jgi:predicted nucleotidyltransferase
MYKPKGADMIVKDLIHNRENLKEMLEEFYQSDPDVLGIFYGGSIGKGNADIYSDIDLRIVVKESIDTKAKIEKLIEQSDDILFVEDLYKQFTVIHFDCFIKLDLFIYYPTQLEPSIWLQDIQIIKDTGKHLKKVKNTSKNLSY